MPGETFRCEQCGREFRWRSAIAGKNARCSCGAVLTVPAAAPSDDLYEFATPEPAPISSEALRNRPVQASTPHAHTSVIGYQSPAQARDAQTEFDSFYSKPRDFYFPTAALAIGFLAILAWAIFAGASGAVLFVFAGYITVATVMKTAVMIGAALVIAPMAGVSFGAVWTAVLKLAAMVVVTDAALYWLEEIMVATGAISANRRFGVGVGLVNTMLACAIIGIFLKIFFDMDRDEVGTVALPLAILNRVLNFIMMLILVGIIAAMESATAPSAGATTPATAPLITGPRLAPASPQTSLADAGVAEAIRNPAQTREALAYYERSLGKPTHRDFVRELYGLGARKVYFQIDLKSRTLAPSGMIIEMPDDPGKREEIFKRVSAFLVDRKLPAADATERSQRYLVVTLPGQK